MRYAPRKIQLSCEGWKKVTVLLDNVYSENCLPISKEEIVKHSQDHNFLRKPVPSAINSSGTGETNKRASTGGCLCQVDERYHSGVVFMKAADGVAAARIWRNGGAGADRIGISAGVKLEERLAGN